MDALFAKRWNELNLHWIWPQSLLVEPSEVVCYFHLAVARRCTHKSPGATLDRLLSHRNHRPNARETDNTIWDYSEPQRIRSFSTWQLWFSTKPSCTTRSLFFLSLSSLRFIRSSSRKSRRRKCRTILLGIIPRYYGASSTKQLARGSINAVSGAVPVTRVSFELLRAEKIVAL